MLTKKTALLGVSIALAIIASYIEMLIPIQFGVPGIKLGLTNIVIVVILYLVDAKSAFFVSVVRIFLVGFLFGNMFSILYSLAGGMLSLLCMSLMKRGLKFSIVGVSIAGGVTHNIGQVAAAIAVVENINVIFYLPILLLAGVITGLLIGLLANAVIKRLPITKYV